MSGPFARPKPAGNESEQEVLLQTPTYLLCRNMGSAMHYKWIHSARLLIFLLLSQGIISSTGYVCAAQSFFPHNHLWALEMVDPYDTENCIMFPNKKGCFSWLKSMFIWTQVVFSKAPIFTIASPLCFYSLYIVCIYTYCLSRDLFKAVHTWKQCHKSR